MESMDDSGVGGIGIQKGVVWRIERQCGASFIVEQLVALVSKPMVNASEGEMPVDDGVRRNRQGVSDESERVNRVGVGGNRLLLWKQIEVVLETCT